MAIEQRNKQACDAEVTGPTSPSDEDRVSDTLAQDTFDVPCSLRPVPCRAHKSHPNLADNFIIFPRQICFPSHTPRHRKIETKVSEKRTGFLFSSMFARDSSERTCILDRETGTKLEASDPAAWCHTWTWSRVCALDDRVVVLTVPGR